MSSVIAVEMKKVLQSVCAEITAQPAMQFELNQECYDDAGSLGKLCTFFLYNCGTPEWIMTQHTQELAQMRSNDVTE